MLFKMHMICLFDNVFKEAERWLQFSVMQLWSDSTHGSNYPFQRHQGTYVSNLHGCIKSIWCCWPWQCDESHLQAWCQEWPQESLQQPVHIWHFNHQMTGWNIPAIQWIKAQGSGKALIHLATSSRLEPTHARAMHALTSANTTWTPYVWSMHAFIP